MSVQEFLNSISSPRTRKGYRFGLNKFVEWFGKPAEEILTIRQENLTQKAGENLVEYRNRAARFEKEIEKFHSYLLENGYSINSARNMTLGIRQLLRYYQMPVTMRSGSKVSQTVKTTKNFPLTIEHVRKMFQVANLKERMVLTLAVDTGLRISDFLAIKRTDLPPLESESPIAFTLMTQKEKIPAHCFLSKETVDLLKTYVPTLKKKNTLYLFASNGKSHISDEAISKMLNRLAQKAQIDLNGKSLTFHCFRKMFLSASIDSGIGLTAGKKLCGKAIARSDDTYLTTVKLREKFIQLKKFLTINQSPEIENQQIEKLSTLVAKLAEELDQQKLVSQAVTNENLKIRKEFKENVAELNKELAFARVLGEQVEKIGEVVKSWQEEKDKLEAKIAGVENFQRLVLDQPDDVVLEFIKDVRRQLREQGS
ncbi:MAG: tyrosine-type recombinase/integrase [Candidatus Bathyarchaeota archaeon]|nr:tyrosine-type recombinase/integrase [Candidatus Bathyarchaeota archaeon]